jgi:hypothetical protein
MGSLREGIMDLTPFRGQALPKACEVRRKAEERGKGKEKRGKRKEERGK